MKLLGFITLIIIGPLLKGLTIVKLWEWFIMPTFRLHPISIPASLGIAYLIALLTARSDTYEIYRASSDSIALRISGIVDPELKAKEEKRFIRDKHFYDTAVIIVPSLAALLAGWIVKHWM